MTMLDEGGGGGKMTEPEPMKPVQAIVIGTGTGDGGPKHQIVETPEGQPNLAVRYITPIVAIGVRAGNVFFSSFVASIGIGATGVVPIGTMKLALLVSCGAAVVNIAQNLAYTFSGLEKKFPIVRA